MKKFLTKLLVFICPLVIIFLFTEHKLRAIPSSYNIKKNYLVENKNKLQTLVFGGSHALNSLNPNYFSSNAINLANASQSLYFDANILNQYIDELPALQTVVFNVSNCSYFYNMNDGREKLRASAYKIFFNIKNQPYDFYDLKNYSLTSFFGPTKVFSIAKNGFKKIEDLEAGSKFLSNGFLETDSAKNETKISDLLGKEKFLYHYKMIKESNAKQNLDVLYKALAKLKEKKVHVYFVYTPTYKTYYKHYLKHLFVKNDSIENILTKNYNAIVLNFSQDARFSIEDFVDNDHLNKYGAVKFSKIFDSTIVAQNALHH